MSPVFDGNRVRVRTFNISRVICARPVCAHTRTHRTHAYVSCTFCCAKCGHIKPVVRVRRVAHTGWHTGRVRVSHQWIRVRMNGQNVCCELLGYA